MNSEKNPVVWLVIGLLSYGLMAFLFPKVSPAAKWNYAINRQTSIQTAQAYAREFLGIDTTGWRATPSIRYNRRTEFYLAHQTSPLGGDLLSTLTTNVTLLDMHSAGRIQVELSSRGKLAGIHLQGQPKSGDSSQADSATAGSSIEADRALAQSAFEKLVSSDYARAFSFSLSDAGTKDKTRKFSWTASDEKTKLIADTVVQDGRLSDLSLRLSLAPSFQQEYDAHSAEKITVLSTMDNFVFWPLIIVAIIFYFLGLARKRIDHRKGLIFAGLIFVYLLVVNFFGSFADSLIEGFRVSGGNAPYLVELLVPWLVYVLLIAILAFGFYLFWTTGIAISAELPERKTISIELLLQGKILTRQVAHSLLAGLAIGGVFAVIPYLIAATNLFSYLRASASGLDDSFTSRSPLIAATVSAYQILVFFIFCLAGPLLQVFLKRQWLVRVTLFVIGLLSFTGAEFVVGSDKGLLLTSALLSLVATATYFRADLLAIAVMCIGAQSAASAAAMLAQPISSLRVNGWATWLMLLIGMFIALVGGRRFREATSEEMALPDNLGEKPDERERLKAEFDVARRAQQQMLPDALPNVPGVDIAAICQPSKEVGGDLYEFLPLSDGRLGVVVADVSGKGVPASLYMTLTKGLLNSVIEEKTDPGEILREVNRHLYEVCRRKVFVTLFLGVIDPIARTLAYARAGHNPTVLWQAGQQTARLLKSPGMGLGLNGGKIFDTSLKVETIQLAPNDKLLFYSDGITEAMNSGNEEYGEERLLDLARKTGGLAAEATRDAVIADVQQFLGPIPPQDDQTLVVVRLV